MRDLPHQKKELPPRLPQMHVKQGQHHGGRRFPPHTYFRPPLPHTLPPQLLTDHALALAQPYFCLQASATYHYDQQALSKTMYTSVCKKDSWACNKWHFLCGCMHVAPDLQCIKDPVPFFQIFLSDSALAFYPRGETPLPLWGLTEQYTTGSERTTFVWADSSRHTRRQNLLLPGSDPSPCTSPTPWTPPSAKLHPDSKTYTISPGLHYYSSYAYKNTTRAVDTPSSTPFDSTTFSYLW